MKINEIEKIYRPREKLINKGVDSLNDTELLAIMLSSGNKNESVLELSNRIIKEYGFDRLFKMSYHELNKINGIKEAKASKLIATFEIARRVISKDIKSRSIRTPKDAFDYIKSDYYLLESEVVTVIYVNTKCYPISKRKYTNKLVDKVDIPIREIVNEAININAFGIILVHNHPSGDLTPSLSDYEATKSLKNILNNLSIMLLDHLIIHNDKYQSIISDI